MHTRAPPLFTPLPWIVSSCVCTIFLRISFNKLDPNYSVVCTSFVFAVQRQLSIPLMARTSTCRTKRDIAVGKTERMERSETKNYNFQHVILCVFLLFRIWSARCAHRIPAIHPIVKCFAPHLSYAIRTDCVWWLRPRGKRRTKGIIIYLIVITRKVDICCDVIALSLVRIVWRVRKFSFCFVRVLRIAPSHTRRSYHVLSYRCSAVGWYRAAIRQSLKRSNVLLYRWMSWSSSPSSWLILSQVASTKAPPSCNRHSSFCRLYGRCCCRCRCHCTDMYDVRVCMMMAKHAIQLKGTTWIFAV